VETIHLLEATELTRNWLEIRGKSGNTVKAYLTDIRMFFQEMEVSEVAVCNLEGMAAAWMNKYRRAKAPKTVGRRLTSIRCLGNALGVPLLKEYNAPTPALAVPHPLPGLARDLKRMVDLARNEEQLAILGLTGMCGLRISEARDASPADFDLVNMRLTVRGKGDRTRVVPISTQAWSVMAVRVVSATINREPHIITVTDRHAREVITRLGERAGISRPVSSHDLRATFATLAYAQSGKDIRAVQQLLGHASVVQTQLYVGVSEEQMRAAASFSIEEDD
jgi:integrase/recombinase XerC